MTHHAWVCLRSPILRGRKRGVTHLTLLVVCVYTREYSTTAVSLRAFKVATLLAAKSPLLLPGRRDSP